MPRLLTGAEFGEIQEDSSGSLPISLDIEFGRDSISKTSSSVDDEDAPPSLELALAGERGASSSSLESLPPLSKKLSLALACLLEFRRS
jgi:hypothetical protein